MASASEPPFQRRFDRVIRYLRVGGGVTAFYTALAVCIHDSRLVPDATVASTIAYLVTQPIAYLIHKRLTFPDAAHPGSHWPRYGVMALAGLAITAGSMKAISILGLPFWVGLLVGWVCIPIANFFISAIWVFRTQELLSIDVTDTKTSAQNLDAAWRAK